MIIRASLKIAFWLFLRNYMLNLYPRRIHLGHGVDLFVGSMVQEHDSPVCPTAHAIDTLRSYEMNGGNQSYDFGKQWKGFGMKKSFHGAL
jgi:hypothetical protein